MSNYNHLINYIENDYFSWENNIHDWICDDYDRWLNDAYKCSTQYQLDKSFYDWQIYVDNVVQNEFNDIIEYYDELVSDF
ncbi:hypothetical protein QKC54_gp1024 [Megavirus baoshan]|uniref:Uncharacterized protein n=1 Tax=Megavirus baoshan TaxID=2496520 RepID=A0A8K1W796_9VIRU|nr:hypothetical protein QKC54_gp1024 [Megavirus baoshan]UFX99718.1 hypothetical protein Mb0048 [Megavirus baoshan]